MATLDATITDCATLFEQAIELVTNMQEDLNLQTLNTEVQELQLQYDEVWETACTLAPMQHLAKLQEGKWLLTQVEEVHKKEALLKSRLQSWLEEAYQVTTTIQDKLKRLQQKQHMMRLVVEGPATEKLVKEVT